MNKSLSSLLVVIFIFSVAYYSVNKTSEELRNKIFDECIAVGAGSAIECQCHGEEVLELMGGGLKVKIDSIGDLSSGDFKRRLIRSTRIAFERCKK